MSERRQLARKSASTSPVDFPLCFQRELQSQQRPAVVRVLLQVFVVDAFGVSHAPRRAAPQPSQCRAGNGSGSGSSLRARRPGPPPVRMRRWPLAMLPALRAISPSRMPTSTPSSRPAGWRPQVRRAGE